MPIADKPTSGVDSAFVQDNGKTMPLRPIPIVSTDLASTDDPNPQSPEQFATLHPDLVVRHRAADVYRVFRALDLTPKQTAWLCAYIEVCGVVHRATVATGFGRTIHYDWLEESGLDGKYSRAFEIAKRFAADNLLAIATDRAVFGTPEPHFYKTDVVGFTTKYSDALMALLLKGEFPEKYGTERQEIEDKRSTEILRRDPGREILTDARITAMLALADKAIAAGVGKQGPGQVQKLVAAPGQKDSGDGDGDGDGDATEVD